MSLSQVLQDEALHLAVKRSVESGIVYTVAAGNADPDGPPRDIAFESPASYPEVLTVTAASDTDGAPGGSGPASCDAGESDDSYATFSNFATRPMDIAHVVAAPGVCIESTARGGGVTISSGTSASAPHVAGVVALCIDEGGVPGPCAEMTPAETIEQIRADAAANATPQNGFVGDPFSPLPVGHYFGHLVSAHDLTVRRIPPRPRPVAAASPTAKADTTLEVLALRIARRQRRRRPERRRPARGAGQGDCTRPRALAWRRRSPDRVAPSHGPGCGTPHLPAEAAVASRIRPPHQARPAARSARPRERDADRQ